MPNNRRRPTLVTHSPKLGDSFDTPDLARLLRRISQMLEVESQNSGWSAKLESLAVPDETDGRGLLRLGVESANFYRGHVKDSYSAEPGPAIRDEDELNPGKQKIIFKTLDGPKVFRNLKADDPIRPSEAPSGDAWAVDNQISESDAIIDAWVLLKDPIASVASRISALGTLGDARHEAAVVEYLLEELGRADRLEPAWRDAIIYAAEDYHFPAGSREALGGILWGIASSLRMRTGVHEKVVWSALRRGSSLLPASKVEGLVSFLEPSVVDTRSVALQCVVRMLEPAPPASPPLTLGERANRFAELFLNRDVFISGEPSVIARNAVAALAAMGDERLAEVLAKVRVLERSWLTRRVGAELERILRGWVGRGAPSDHPAVSNLKGALKSLA